MGWWSGTVENVSWGLHWPGHLVRETLLSAHSAIHAAANSGLWPQPLRHFRRRQVAPNAGIEGFQRLYAANHITTTYINQALFSNPDEKRRREKEGLSLAINAQAK